ncbi:MAG: ABC transporter ATP-binding protein [Sciscionella sp.]
MITFQSVTKRFPDGTLAVRELDLEVPTGKITVLVGPSGCGKTTSLRMINRMIEPTSGDILIDGTSVTSGDPAELRLSIGYVIQQAGLFPHRTVVDNIATVPYLLGWSKTKARARSMELMERVGLDTELANRFPIQLSGGQQQRVGVARALAADPPVMLMDEPFSAVDPIVRESLQQEFLHLQGDLGKTIAFVTHDIDEAIKLGDRVAVFQVGGQLAQVGSPARLLSAPADDFVADFVGRDRGFRGLSFVPAAALDVEAAPGGDRHGWSLQVDASNRPIGWRNGSSASAEPLRGTFTAEDPIRLALDLAITSPSGVAVRVDANGAADGLLSHESIARQLAATPHLREAVAAEAGAPR